MLHVSPYCSWEGVEKATALPPHHTPHTLLSFKKKSNKQALEAKEQGIADVCRLLATPEDLGRLEQYRAEVRGVGVCGSVFCFVLCD